MPAFVRWSAALAVAFLAGSPESRAWGPVGHRVAAKVAEGRLTPAARAAVAGLLDEDKDLGTASNWPDVHGRKDIPESAPWHYVNVPLTEPRYDAKFCQPGGCVVSKIKDFRKILADRSAPKADRRLALRFLAHFVEDIHMPLHVGHMDDKGGNLCQVRFLGRGSNLHRVWDSGVIEATGTEAAWIEQATQLAATDAAQGWLWGDVEDWADESLKLAHQAYYFPAGTDRPIKSGAILGEDYETFATPILRLRLAQAGVRLANELNAIFP